MSMIFCRGCGKEIHESATTCPHCGAPQGAQSAVTQNTGQPWSTGRMVTYGFFSFFLPLIGFIAGIVGLLKEPTRKQGAILLALALGGVVMYTSIFKGGSSTNGAKSSAVEKSSAVDKYAELAATPPAPLAPTGELAAMFNLGSDNTDLQRENKLKEIKGKVVEWTLPVYEVEKDGDDYKVQTEADNAVNTFIYISPRNDQDKAVIEALKTGSRVSIKGIIKDDFMRSLVIKPAILFQPGSAKPAAAQAPQPTYTPEQAPIQAAPNAQPEQEGLVEIYPGKSGSIYIKKGGVEIEGQNLNVDFVAKSRKDGKAINYSMSIDCQSEIGMIDGAELVQGKNESVPLTLNEAADQVKSMIGLYPSDKAIVGGLCKSFMENRSK